MRRLAVLLALGMVLRTLEGLAWADGYRAASGGNYFAGWEDGEAFARSTLDRTAS